MNPILSHVIVGAASALAGAVLAIVFMPKYNAAAEAFELFVASDFQGLAKWAQAKADALKQPGK